MLKVGLTGGIATGKSTVSRLFVECGARLIDADVLAREAVAPGTPACREIAAAFGKDMLRTDGSVDRERLGAAVFTDPAKRARLEAIIHPHVFAGEERLFRTITAEDPHAVVLFDAALLIETGAHKRKDRVIVITADEPTQLRRLMDRNKLTEEEARQRIRSQMPLTEKVTLADHVIDGTLPVEQLRKEVQLIYEKLKRLAS
ncbi:MAG: dephospho-CoA kinase [Nitrospiraceae bacterium]|nr:MAG: dephospho-CoA kinase [Nitrospiraceae bacterium]